MKINPGDNGIYVIEGWRILRTCVPGLMTNAEATGADVLDSYFPDNQFEIVIHASSKVC